MAQYHLAFDVMAENEPLDVYLNDHLAASAAAVELVERLVANNDDETLDTFLTDLGQEIDTDRTTLRTVMERLGVPPSTSKQVAGKVLETISRFRLNERVTGSAEVSRLMELETLSLGIEGKLSLWRSLARVAGSRPELAAFDLQALMTRAIQQRSGLEPFRLDAAAAALGRP
jgi:hypothetical protein